MDSAIAPDRHSASAERVDSSSVLVAKVKFRIAWILQPSLRFSGTGRFVICFGKSKLNKNLTAIVHKLDKCRRRHEALTSICQWKVGKLGVQPFDFPNPKC